MSRIRISLLIFLILTAVTTECGASVQVRGAVVLSDHNSTRQDFRSSVFYVTSPDRSSGLQVVNFGFPGPIGVSRGDIVDVDGVMQVDFFTNETYLATFGQINVTASGTANPAPLHMPNWMIGGTSIVDIWGNLRPGVTRPLPLGLYNKGLLISTWGRITHVNYFNRFFYIDDGSRLEDGYGPYGVRISYDYIEDGFGPPLTPPSLNSYVRIVGISSSETWLGETIRMVRLRSQSDIQMISGSYEMFSSQYLLSPAETVERSITGARVNTASYKNGVSSVR